MTHYDPADLDDEWWFENDDGSAPDQPLWPGGPTREQLLADFDLDALAADALTADDLVDMQIQYAADRYRKEGKIRDFLAANADYRATSAQDAADRAALEQLWLRPPASDR